MKTITTTEAVTLPVESRLIKTEGELNYVKVPSIGDILRHQLMAYATQQYNRHSIYQNGKDASKAEIIIKQLYDIARLFEKTEVP